MTVIRSFQWLLLKSHTMRNKIFFIWAAVRWLLLMFLIAPALEAPLVAYPGNPIKPLRVWRGLASWYGPRFDGRLTANGEIYDMYAPTAAHLSLPFGALVRLVDTKTGRSQVVRINDRGPFIEGREIDVSYEVACRLGMEDRGLAWLRLELLEVPRRR
jgi:rare lipoprotein A (peptidoglycan hydrolase)